MSKFDALALPVDATGRMVIKHPTTGATLRDRDGKEAYIDLYSGDSEVAERQRRAITNDRLSMRNRNKITSERLESEGLELLVALTTGWNLVALDGSPIDLAFSPQEARNLYGDRRMRWLREQVDEFTADRANFVKASS